MPSAYLVSEVGGLAALANKRYLASSFTFDSHISRNLCFYTKALNQKAKNTGLVVWVGSLRSQKGFLASSFTFDSHVSRNLWF